MTPPSLRRLALAGMVALLVGGAACAETPEPAQDDSIEALRTRANVGDAGAQVILWVMYATGLGVPQDYAEAVRWYRLAAEQGEAFAQSNLGIMYANGRGVPQDYMVTHMGLNLAGAQSSGDARATLVKGRDAVEAKLTSEQIAEAQRLAREWKPTVEP